MKSRKRLKKSLGLNLFNKVIALLLAVSVPTVTLATPTGTVLDQGLPGMPGPVWCYDSEANAVLVTAAEHERQNCQLHLEMEIEKQKSRYELRISNLQLRISTQEEENEKILKVKDNEIEQLTAAALKRPDEYNHWWFLGGAVVGTVVTLTLGWMILSAQSGHAL